MNSERSDAFSRPPGLIASFTAGFNSVANHIALITLPALFDLFLWLGPRLNVLEVFRPFLAAMPRLYGGMMDAETLAQAQEFWNSFLTRINLFALLRTFPMGVSSLLASEMPLESPLGTPIVWSLTSFWTMLVAILLLIPIGWFLGGLYFSNVARIALSLPNPPGKRAIGHSILLSFFWLAVLSFGFFASLTLAGIFGWVNPALGQLVFYTLLFLSLWTLVPIYFSIHGIFAFQMNAIQSVLSSLRLTRFTFPFTSLFLTISLLLSLGLRFLWLTPPADSWWLLVGILSNDYISTALLAASFIYYRDMSLWLEKALKQIQAQRTTLPS
ncbi:MAG: hypothetical protein N2049_02375 [Anaerolineales bacterium]|nr:hypothetical protein [Anaerolineales bacterium]